MISAPPGETHRSRAAARPWRVWVTRAEPGASRTAARLAALGHVPLVAPLISLAPLEVADLSRALDGAAALAFTSAEGVARFAPLVRDRRLRVYAVGEATAAAARAEGWRDVCSADADGAALAALVAADAPAGPVLAPGARDRAFDLAAALAPRGVAVRRLDLYHAAPTAALPPAVIDALARTALDALLIHSPAAARALTALAPGAPGLSAATVLALSPACAAALDVDGVEPVGAVRRIAAAPRERDLLALLPRLGARPRLG